MPRTPLINRVRRSLLRGSSTSSTGLTNCSVTSTACAGSPKARTVLTARSSACCRPFSKCCENGATYLGVATDHVIESFRNRLWPDYKTGAGIEPALLAQFHPLEEALAAMGVVVWPMIELEADDALASAAHLASKDKKVEKVAIWTPDKDLAQCVRGTRVVQIDGRRKTIRDAAGIREKFGVSPQLIPDLLALVGDAADGYPGIPGIGAKTAAQLLNRYGPIENFPSNVLGEQRDLALLFKNLATLRTDAPLFKKVETLRWRGATPAFAAWAERMEAPRLLERCDRVKLRHAASKAAGR